MFRKGFSLIEVNMAILISAGGLLSLFTLFPVGLKQSEMSSEDLYQATYASSTFQMISGNVATIYDVEEWNNPNEFWKIATEGTGIQSKLQRMNNLNSKDSLVCERYIDYLFDGNSGETDNVWYVGTDFNDKDGGFKDEKSPSMPQQYLIRLYRKRNTGIVEKGEVIPAVYVVSMVSTSIKSPAIYYENTPYSMEFSFYGKVWAKPPEVSSNN